MDPNIRPITKSEIPALYATFRRAMGFPPESEAEAERSINSTNLDRTLAAFDGKETVGSTYSHLFEYTLPGGVQIPAAGVTAVGVLPTHRRRGIISALMRRQLAEAKQRDEPAAILIASEGVIYGRFGYGVASLLMDYDIDTRDAAIRAPRNGTVRFIDEKTADKVFVKVHDRWRGQQPGAIRREESWWQSWRDDRKPGVEPLIVYESATGEVEGYARYSVSARWEQGMASHKANVQELVSTSNDAAAALWRHILSLDLVRTVSAGARPVDDPLRWNLANPRALRVTRVGDFMWLRILDVPRVLSARTYAADVRLVLDVKDGLLPEVGGKFELTVSSGDVSVEPTKRRADLRMPIAELGSITSGAVAPSELAAVGRIQELSDGAVRDADRAFASAPKPWGCTWF